MDFLATYIMRGRLQAIIAASSLALLSLIFPPVSVVSVAAVALVTLRLGATEGLYVLGCAGLATGLLGWFLLGGGIFQFALLYAVVFWLPIWLNAIVLRESRHLSLAVELAAFLGAVGVAIAYISNPDLASVWNGMLTQMIPLNLPPDAPVDEVKHTFSILSHYTTGMMASVLVLALLLGLFLGRWWQANLYNPGGFRAEYLSLRIQPRLAIGSLLIVAFALATSGIVAETAWNIVILFFFLCSVMGTAVLHTLFASMKLARFTVPMLYITLVLIPHAFLLVALVGLADAWLDLRKNQSKHTTPKA